MYKELCTIAGEPMVLRDEPMKNHTSFRIGGNADYYVCPSDEEQIGKIISLCEANGTDYYICGNGTNLLVGDRGFRGVMIQIKNGFQNVETEDTTVKAGAGILMSALSSFIVQHDLTGFEFASGIPGTLGGGIAMNAGAYDGELKDVIKEVEVFIPGQGVKWLKKEELALGYRTSVIQTTDWIVLRAVLELKKGDPEKIAARIDELRRRRCEKQPLELPSAGSTFRRPEGYFAGKLITDSGLKGFAVGDAQVSKKHAGFIVNNGNASAQDVKRLIEHIQKTVKEQTGVELQTEVRFVGEF